MVVWCSICATIMYLQPSDTCLHSELFLVLVIRTRRHEEREVLRLNPLNTLKLMSILIFFSSFNVSPDVHEYLLLWFPYCLLSLCIGAKRFLIYSSILV